MIGLAGFATSIVEFVAVRIEELFAGSVCGNVEGGFALHAFGQMEIEAETVFKFGCLSGQKLDACVASK